MKSIAVLLTVFNRKEKTLQCLGNLYKQLPIQGYSVDIYLTNDGCTDSTPEAIAQKFPEVNIRKEICFGTGECIQLGKKQPKEKNTIITYG